MDSLQLFSEDLFSVNLAAWIAYLVSYISWLQMNKHELDANML